MMLIACDVCNSKIRVPDSAAGKRIKCPKCANLVSVPAAEKTPEPASAEPEMAPIPTLAPEPAPEAQKEEPGETEVTASAPYSTGKKPPPIKTKRASSIDDNSDEDDEDDEPKPPKKRRKEDDDDDDDEDGVDVSNRRRQGRSAPVNGMAMTSMIVGITSVVIGLPGCFGCCCYVTTTISLICGIVAVILGFMGKSSGSESYSTTGIICGFVGVGLSLVGVLVLILSLVFNIGFGGLNDFNQGFNRGFNQGFNQGRPPFRR